MVCEEVVMLKFVENEVFLVYKVFKDLVNIILVNFSMLKIE